MVNSDKTLDIIVIGDLNMDFILDVPYHPLVKNLSGSSNAVRGSNLYFGTGGAAANTAHALASLKNKVGFVGIVGDDLFGKQLVADMSNKGIDISHTALVEGNNTGLVFRFKDENNNKSLIYSSPGPQKFLDQSLETKYLSKTKIVYISGNILTQSEAMGEKIISGIAKIKNSEKIIILDPGRFWLTEKYSYLVKKLLPYVDILLPNKYEAQLITGNSDPIVSADKLFDYGIRSVVIKMGNNGAVYISPEEKISVPAFTVQVDSTFGAGDVFNAGLIHGVLRNWEIKKSLSFASVLSGLKVQSRGTQEGVAPEHEVLKHIDELLNNTSL